MRAGGRRVVHDLAVTWREVPLERAAAQLRALLAEGIADATAEGVRPRAARLCSEDQRVFVRVAGTATAALPRRLDGWCDDCDRRRPQLGGRCARCVRFAVVDVYGRNRACGSRHGYHLHRAADEDACRACLDAEAADRRARRARHAG